MSKSIVIGIDLGVNDSVIAYLVKGGVDIVQNEVSQRKTPTIVGFNDKDRLLGDAAQVVVKSNLKNTCRNFRHLLKQTLESDDYKKEKFWSLAELVTMDDGFLGFSVNYRGEQQVFSCAQIIAMYLTKMKETAEKWSKGTVLAAVISVPAYYNDAQRACMLDACQIAQLHCLRLMNEHTATALAYGIYRNAEFSEKEEEAHTAAFVNMGHSNCTISIAKYVKGKLDVLAEASNRHCAGRDMDEVLMRHFAAAFSKKFGCDPMTNKKAILKMEEGVQKVKKTLSANNEGSISIECLMEDEDMSGKIDRPTFEELCKPLQDRVEAAIDECIKKAGNPKIDVVEVIGGASRVPWFKEVCQKKFEKDLSFTLNADEAVARGCALQAAILSPLYKVREFEVIDRVVRPVVITWMGGGSQSIQDKDGDEDMEADVNKADEGEDVEKKMECFAVGDKMDCKKFITWHRNGPFEIKASYVDSEKSDELGKFFFDLAKSEDKKKLKIGVKMTQHGTFTMESCTIHETEQYVDKIKEKREVDDDEPEKKMDVDTEQEQPQEGDVAMSDAGTAATDAPTPEEGAEKKEEGAAEGAKDAKSPPKEKKKKIIWVEVEKSKTRSKKTPVGISNKGNSLSVTSEIMGKFIDFETQMQATTREVRETDEKRNDMETYIYKMRSELVEDSGEYAPYMMAAERTAFSDVLMKAEDWLYDNFEATKVQLEDQIMELKKVGDAPVTRKETREKVKEFFETSFAQSLSDVRARINNPHEDFAHIAEDKKQECRDKTDEFEAWAQSMLQKQNSLALTEEPVFTIDMIKEKAVPVSDLVEKVMSEPKPKPPPKEEEKKEEAAPAEGEKSPEKKEGEEPKAETPAADEDVKMDGATQDA